MKKLQSENLKSIQQKEGDLHFAEISRRPLKIDKPFLAFSVGLPFKMTAIVWYSRLNWIQLDPSLSLAVVPRRMDGF